MSIIERPFRLDGKVALLTGGSSGLGVHMAIALAEAGARIYITGRDNLRLDATAAEMPLESDCIPIVADVLEKEDVARIVDTVRGKENQFDILVNNAGVMNEMPIDDYSEEEWDRTMNTNVKAAFFLTQALLPLMRAAGSMEDPARIVNIGSGQGLRPAMRWRRTASTSMRSLRACSTRGRTNIFRTNCASGSSATYRVAGLACPTISRPPFFSFVVTAAAS